MDCTAGRSPNANFRALSQTLQISAQGNTHRCRACSEICNLRLRNAQKERQSPLKKIISCSGCPRAAQGIRLSAKGNFEPNKGSLRQQSSMQLQGSISERLNRSAPASTSFVGSVQTPKVYNRRNISVRAAQGASSLLGHSHPA